MRRAGLAYARWAFTALLPMSIAAVLFTHSGAAEAKCPSATRCLCIGETTHSILDARVERSDGQSTTFEILAEHPARDGGLAGELIEVRDGKQDEVGARWLLYYLPSFSAGDGGALPGGIVLRVPVEGDEAVCEEAEPDFRLSVPDAIEAGLSADCRSILQERGLKNPPCEDSGGACGAAPGDLPSSALPMLFVAALVWLGLRRLRTP